MTVSGAPPPPPPLPTPPPPPPPLPPPMLWPSTRLNVIVSGRAIILMAAVAVPGVVLGGMATPFRNNKYELSCTLPWYACESWEIFTTWSLPQSSLSSSPSSPGPNATAVPKRAWDIHIESERTIAPPPPQVWRGVRVGSGVVQRVSERAGG